VRRRTETEFQCTNIGDVKQLRHHRVSNDKRAHQSAFWDFLMIHRETIVSAVHSDLILFLAARIPPPGLQQTDFLRAIRVAMESVR